jgi:hypothetical protein
MNPQREKTLLDRLDNPETATGKLARRYDEKIEGNIKSAIVAFCLLLIGTISTVLAIWLGGNGLWSPEIMADPSKVNSGDVWWLGISILWTVVSGAMWRNHLFTARQWASMAQDSRFWSMATKIDDSKRRR